MPIASGAKAPEYIHHFVHSKNPRFKGKSKAERIRMALGAFYGANKRYEKAFVAKYSPDQARSPMGSPDGGQWVGAGGGGQHPKYITDMGANVKWTDQEGGPQEAGRFGVWSWDPTQEKYQVIETANSANQLRARHNILTHTVPPIRRTPKIVRFGVPGYSRNSSMPGVPQKLDKFCKVAGVDDSLGLVFGWAIICKEAGEDYWDVQEDHIPEKSMLHSATDFMANSRVIKEMHAGEGKGTVVFAWPMTGDIAEAMGITTKNTGFMIGVKPDDPEILAKFKSGEYTGFSIGGTRLEDEEI